MLNNKTPIVREALLNKVIQVVSTREELYDRLYKAADFICKKHNPCGINNSTCKASINFCCSGCKHLTKQGCNTNALYCRLWLCSGSAYTKTVACQLHTLKTIASYYGLLKPRSNKEETFNNNHRGW